jgi:hypothetical protein
MISGRATALADKRGVAVEIASTLLRAGEGLRAKWERLRAKGK